MKKFTKILSLLLCLAMVFSFAACTGKTDDSVTTTEETVPADTTPINITTLKGPTGMGMAKLISDKNAQYNISIATAATEIAPLIIKGEADIAACPLNLAAAIYKKSGGKVKMIAINTLGVLSILENGESVKSVADLKGKNVSIGAAGSGVYFNAMDVLSAYGLTESDINPTYQSFGDSADSLKNGQIDAAFIVAGAPTTAITDLETTKDVYLVSLDDEHVDQLLASSPYYTKVTIGKDVYGLDTDTITVAVSAVVLARDDVSEDAIYKLVADIFDNAASLTDTHAKYAEISTEYGASITSVPYHPGAAKYFAEKGFELPTK